MSESNPRIFIIRIGGACYVKDRNIDRLGAITCHVDEAMRFTRSEAEWFSKSLRGKGLVMEFAPLREGVTA